jgi:hypothetical protein
MHDEVVFANPSFEEDFENDGVPDRWEIPKTTHVTLVGDSTHGAKAARFDDGYVLAAQNFQIRNLAGRTLVVRVDVKGEEGATFGCLAGCFRTTADGKRRFVHSRLAWDSKLTADFQRFKLRYHFSETALDGRLWIAFYRSNRKGIVWLDNVEATAHSLTDEQRTELTRLAREYTYLSTRARTAEERFPQSAERLKSLAERTSKQAEAAGDGGPDMLGDLPERLADIAAGHARINALLGGDNVHVRWAPACERLAPDAGPSGGGVPSPRPVALQNESVYVGVDILNPFGREVPLTVNVTAGEGFASDPQLRRQVFMETWYKKASTRIVDPLPLLPRRDGHWELTIPAGGRERLFLHLMSTTAASGDQPIQVSVATDAGAPQVLTCAAEILAAPFPSTPRFEHIQFMYPDKQPALSHPEATARDLASHGVSGIEFPYIPKVAFSAEGQLVSADFENSLQAEWMSIYGRHLPYLMIFWEGRYRKFPVAGLEDTYLEYLDEDGDLTPEFRTAYSELLRAWLAFARSRGFGADRFLMLADDEPSSKEDAADAPGKEVRRTLELYRLTREVAPDLPICVTLSDYATPPDVAVLAPAVDVIFPLWPYREKLTRWVPEDYRPREAFRDTIYPLLDRQRRDRGLRVWSYHIDPGKSAPVLTSARAYPLIAAGAGFTGVATWAYNVTRGKSWDDTDEGLLDYIFIYDGTEDHPLNRAVNPTGEIVVPSIRWEAMRLGWQDAQILNCLREKARKTADAELQRRVNELLSEPSQWAVDPSTATFEAVREISESARRLFVEAAAR